MEFRDLKQQYRVLKPQMDAAVQAVMAETNFISGAQVTQLEERLAAYTGRKHCIACANGTDALVLVLRAWGIGPGDAVFVPDFTFFASAECAAAVGATPIFVDVCEDTFNIDANSLEAAVRRVQQDGRLTPRVVVPVDLFGLPANYAAVQAVAEAHGLLVLEDAAQGFGGRLGPHAAGHFGQAATTSFFPAKPLGCYGDGGAIFTDSDDDAALIRSLTVHGKGAGGKYDNVRIGYNSRLDTLQAAVLLVKLAVFDDEVAAVNRAVAGYTARLATLAHTPVVPPGSASSWAQYTLRLQSEAQRAALAQALQDAGVPCMVYYPKTMSQQGAFAAALAHQVVDTPVAKQLCQTVLSLPCHPYLADADIGRVCEVAEKALGG